MDSTEEDLCFAKLKNEKELLARIRQRFERDQFYSFVDDLAVVVNPCKSQESSDSDGEGHSGRFNEEDTRLAAVSRLVGYIWDCMRQSGRSQSVMLTGHSGSGKTETGKHLTKALISVSKSYSGRFNDAFSQASDLLEAFGNAATGLSDNASRFIKLTEFLFTVDNQLVAGYIHHYLLEKTRLFNHTKDERTFNIFYHFLLGMDEDTLRKFNLLKSDYHRCTGSDIDWEADVDNEKCKLSHILKNMDSVGFLPEMKNSIFSMLAAILHIGDLTFISLPNQMGVAVSSRNVESLRNACTLLDVTAEDLELALVADIIYSKGSLVRRARTISESCEARDSMCTALYQRLFAIIVWKINQHLAMDDDDTGQPFPRDSTPEHHKISILDPCGFEDLDMNGIEELCINTVNEQLAHFYNQHIFEWEQDDRESEGLLFQRIEFPDNKPIVKLLLERPKGIFAEVDEQSKSCKSTDTSLVKKLNSRHDHHPGYSVANELTPAFSINHYAGKVTYSATNMLSRNKDMLSGSIIKCLQGSQDELISMLFKLRLSRSGSIFMPETDGGSPLMSNVFLKKKHLKKMRVTVRRKTEMIGDVHGYSKTSPRKKDVWHDQIHLTLTGQLRYSLSDLLEKTFNSDIHFVRCIKPNKELVPQRFDDELVAAQLKCSGIMESIDMREQGFPIRIAFASFIDRYKVLAYPFTAVPKYSGNTCETILMRTKSDGWKIGKTKIFMKNQCRTNLEKLHNKILQGIIIIQKLYRGRQARSVFTELKFLQQREKTAATFFFLELENKMDTVYSHICNQVSEEDRKVNISHYQLSQQTAEEDREKALGILEGRKPTTPKGINFSPKVSTSNSPWAETDVITNPVQRNEDHLNSTPDPQSVLSVVDAFDFSNDVTSNVISSTDQELSPSIMDVFGLGSEASSPGLFVQDTTGSPVGDPSSALSIVDVFGFSNQEDQLDETRDLSELSLVDAFSFSPVAHDIERETALQTTADENANYPQRPGLSARDSNLSAVSTDSKDSIDHVDEEIDMVARATSAPWCTITCHERDIPRGEFTVDRPIIIVDGSNTTFDVTRIGLGALPIQTGDVKVEKVRRCIGKGITLVIDDEGSLWVKRRSKNLVYIKGYYLSTNAVDAKGVLPREQLIKVFDYSLFVAKLEYECQPKRFDPEILKLVLGSVRVFFIFVTDSEHDVDTPCWLEVVMSEPLRIAQVAVKLAKEKRREEQVKRDERTPPILKAKIGKSRQVIAIGAMEKKIRPGRYVDSFKFGRRDWARKRVSVNPFAYGANSLFTNEEVDRKGRSFSSPAELLDHSEFAGGEETITDDVFSAVRCSDNTDLKSLTEIQRRDVVADSAMKRSQADYELRSRSEDEGAKKKVWARKK